MKKDQNIIVTDEAKLLEDPQPQNNTYATAINRSPDSLGINLLLSSNILSPSVVQKLINHQESRASLQLLKYIDEGNEREVKELALNSQFKLKNEEFINSGKAIIAALQRNQVRLAEYLLENGYILPISGVIEAIDSFPDEIVSSAIKYSQNQKNIELIAWYLLYKGCHQSAQELNQKYPELSEYFQSDLRILENRRQVYTNRKLVTDSMLQALQNGFDNLASLLLTVNPTSISPSMIKIAVDNCCINFLKRVWTGNIRKPTDLIKKVAKSSKIWNALKEQVNDDQDLKDLMNSMAIPYLIEKWIELEKISAVRALLKWPKINEEEGVIRKLVQCHQEDLAREIPKIAKIDLTEEDFREAFDAGLYNLCVDLLEIDEAEHTLFDPDVQKKLVELLDQGKTCLQAIEMLNRINLKYWSDDLTQDMCSNLEAFAKKRDEIVVCWNPILFCALTAEFLTNLSETSLKDSSTCLETADIFKDLGLCLEKAIKEERILRYYLTKVDSQGRNALTIMAQNQFYSMLDCGEIGTIVTKMWIGPTRDYGILGASTIYTSFNAAYGEEKGMSFAYPMKNDLPYTFHYDQWLDSCKLRFYGQAVSAITLLIIYQMTIYTAIADNAFLDITNSQSCLPYLRTAQVWIGSIILEDILYYIYQVKAGRIYQFTNWNVLNIMMFCLMLFNCWGFGKRYMGPGKYFSDEDPYTFNALMHSLMLIFMWIRLLSILLASKTFGPFLKMIWKLLIKMIDFYIIYAFLIVGSAAVFTSIFGNSNSYFPTFSESVRFLYSGALMYTDFSGFTEYIALGSVMYGAYMIAAAILFLNLMISKLFLAYSQIIEEVESEHRAAITNHYNRFSWDSRYGALIFLPTPLNYITLAVCPLVLFTANPTKWNTRICKVFYIVYAIPQFVLFALGSLIFAIFMYGKGLIIYGKTGYVSKFDNKLQIFSMNFDDTIMANKSIRDEKVQVKFSYWKSFKWIFIGAPWLIWALLRDCVHYWMIIYDRKKVLLVDDNEFTKIQEMVDSIFLAKTQKILRGIVEEKISINQFLEIYAAYMKIDLKNNEEKRELLYEYFMQYADSTKIANINISRMKKILPRRSGKYFTQSYLEHAQNINVPWLMKGLKQYQRQIGSINIGGLTLPKLPSAAKSGIDPRRIDILERQIRELEHKYNAMLDIGRKMRNEMEMQVKYCYTRDVRSRAASRSNQTLIS
ncbi:unnamed protein product [Blepharisma stoltei]|uniref:Uncharacterized protein n=1 Tax=Blepharisma stoltei TaxID=1481888 RepID=A0AAU9K7P0_9CILI|nr:unnamed protein product [Blepharisma stoltei]